MINNIIDKRYKNYKNERTYEREWFYRVWDNYEISSFYKSITSEVEGLNQDYYINLESITKYYE